MMVAISTARAIFDRMQVPRLDPSKPATWEDVLELARRLMRGERVTYKSDWFTLQDAALQLSQTGVFVGLGWSSYEVLQGSAEEAEESPGTVLGARGPCGPYAPNNQYNKWFLAGYVNKYKEQPNYASYQMAQAFLGVKLAWEKAQDANGGKRDYCRFEPASPPRLDEPLSAIRRNFNPRAIGFEPLEQIDVSGRGTGSMSNQGSSNISRSDKSPGRGGSGSRCRGRAGHRHRGPPR